jgi:hypothetical protein
LPCLFGLLQRLIECSPLAAIQVAIDTRGNQSVNSFGQHRITMNEGNSTTHQPDIIGTTTIQKRHN